MTDPPSAERAETRALSMTGLGLLCQRGDKIV
jgi:hypothetical protein